MIRLPKTVFSFGATALAAGALVLTAPRAAHAIAAALVQVTNTAANPAIAQGVEKLASQNVLLVSPTGAVQPRSAVVLQQMLPDGAIAGSPFVVPAGQSLIVTTVDVLPTDSGPVAVGIANVVSGVFREEFVMPGVSSVQLQFPNGLVFPAGESVLANSYGESAQAVIFTIHGYLTSN